MTTAVPKGPWCTRTAVPFPLLCGSSAAHFSGQDDDDDQTQMLPKKKNNLKKRIQTIKKKYARIAQRQSVCFVSKRSWVQDPL